MSQETEIRMDAYREDIWGTITSWYKPELEEFDALMILNYNGLSEDEQLEYQKAMHHKMGLKTQINSLTTKVILVFSDVLDSLEDHGVFLVKDEALTTELNEYLTRLGIKLKRLEGACLDKAEGEFFRV